MAADNATILPEPASCGRKCSRAKSAPDTEAAIAKTTRQYYYPVQEDPISKQKAGMDMDSGLCICVSPVATR